MCRELGIVMARRGRKKGTANENKGRVRDYRHLKHRFQPQKIYSDDEVIAIHNTALRTLEDLGVKFLLPEARQLLASAGAIVDSESQIVRIGRELIESALSTAPRSFMLRGATRERDQLYDNGSLLFSSGAGCPHANDMRRGRRPATLRDFEETLILQQQFDTIHKFGPSVEPQDVPVNIRHYATIRAQLALGEKPLFVYSRGTQQVEESFEIVRKAFQLSEDDFHGGCWTTTIVNTNSPRLVDSPMAQGIIDFARSRQLCIVTPFCLAGAMAPVTITGALVLQHAEALACIALSQIACAGAPVSYGGFSSNVDLKSGAPSFGTPEQILLALGSGQLARHIGLPWRSSAGAASNTADMQAAGETHMALWGAMLANATLIVHAAGWLEGGLAFGYEKFINDVEALQILAELSCSVLVDEGSLAWEALSEVEPGGHFFGAKHTLSRYKDAFYAPLLADLRNFGSWSEAGGHTSTERSVALWEKALCEHCPPPHSAAALDRVESYIEQHISTGGAPPMGT